jgi:Transposase DDE domain
MNHRKPARRSPFFLSIEVQGLGPWRGLGLRPNLTCFIGRWLGAGHHPPAAPIPRSGFVHGSNAAEAVPNASVRFSELGAREETGSFRPAPAMPQCAQGGDCRLARRGTDKPGALTLSTVFRPALRQTEGLIGSVIRLLGLDLPVPDHTTLSRRAATLVVPRPSRTWGCYWPARPS